MVSQEVISSEDQLAGKVCISAKGRRCRIIIEFGGEDDRK